jgi:hypothetical protein
MRFNEIKTTITEAKKSALLKHGSTRGHLGEYLIGSAVVAKLIAGEDTINAENVKTVITQTSATDNLSQTFDGVEGDEIEFVNIIKNEKNIADAKDVESLLSDMQSELMGAVKFANSDVVAKKWSRLIAKNGKPDRVLVKAAGEENQSGTKADIFLIYKKPDGTEKTIKGWSLKTGSNLIGQASPRTFENMEVFFKDMGVTLQPIENYNENPAEHVVSVMQQVSDDLNKLTAGDDTAKEAKLIDNVAGFMDEHLTKKDPRVYIVNLGKGDYTAQTMRTMRKNLANVNLETSLQLSGRPTFYVHSIGNQKNFLFMIRYTYSAPRIDSKGKRKPERHKLVVETGPLFKTLGTITTKDVEAEPEDNPNATV